MMMQLRWWILGCVVIGATAGCGSDSTESPAQDSSTSNPDAADGSTADSRAPEVGGGDSGTKTDSTTPTTDSRVAETSTDARPSDGNVEPRPDTAPPDLGLPDVATGDPCRGTVVPAEQHYAPADLCVRAIGSVRDIRQIVFAPDGALFGVTKGGRIVRMFDQNGNGVFESSEVATWAEAGADGNNCHIDADEGFLYAGFTDGVRRWKWTPGSTTGTDPQVVLDDAPAGGSHPLHTTHVWSEGGKRYMYVMSGSAGNVTPVRLMDYDAQRSLIKRFDLSKYTGTPLTWASGETLSRGLRNMVGFNRDASGRIFGVVNGSDNVHYKGVDVHNDNPGEQLVQITAGADFGYPFCFTAQRVLNGTTLIAPGTQLRNSDYDSTLDDAWCATNSRQPTTFFQAHSAPLDLVFFDGNLPSGNLPERYRGGAFVSLHGSWNRIPGTGYKVVWVPFDAQGKAPMPTGTANDTTFPYEVVFGGGTAAAGPRDGSFAWANASAGISEQPRPVGVAVSPFDGALYVSSDSGGVLYRIGTKR